MSRLEIKKNGQTVILVPLSETVTQIGRSKDCDVVLPDDMVSRKHAQVINENGVWKLKDLKSTAGTFFQGNPIDEVEITDGVSFHIGPWSLVFHAHNQAVQKSDDEMQTAVTRLVDEPITRVLKLDPQTNELERTKVTLVIHEPDSTPKEVTLRGREWVLGSSPECDIVFGDEYVSARHSKIAYQSSTFIITDLGSTNGTLMGDVKIKESHLPYNEEILIGKSRIWLKEILIKEETGRYLSDHLGGLVGKTPAMQRLYQQIQLVAPSDVAVLIQAETGCGKELVARSLHDLSTRASGNYVVINCGAISPQLIESELFGHEKGAFTGALQRRVGAFEQAHEGTLVLDEIGELPLELQPKLLRALENRSIRRVGGTSDITVNVRVIAATNRDLVEEVRQNRFREDLYFRLHVIPLSIPALRERREDIPFLAEYFIKQIDPSSNNRKKLTISAKAALMNYSWPGNVRELKNTLMRSYVMTPGHYLDTENLHLPQESKKTGESLKLTESEKDKILEAMHVAEGNKSQAAQLLGIARSTLFKKLKEYGVSHGD